jgi:6-phosphofructokinase 2
VIIEVAEETREDFTVTEEKSGQQYRFVLPGSPLSETEWSDCLNALAGIAKAPSIVVASGSLPPNVPVDFYARAAGSQRTGGPRWCSTLRGRRSRLR